MPSIYQFSELEMLAFFLVVLRMSSFVVSWPVFGVGHVPTTVKVLFAFTLSLVIFPLIGWQNMPMGVETLTSMEIIWLGLREIFIGLAFGYLARVFFHAINIAGDLIGISMGLSSSQLFNPDVGGSTSANSQFLLIIATLFFLAINGHHLFISGMADSYSIIPITTEGLSFQAFGSFGQLLQEIVLMGIKMCMPVMISILFMNISMAVIGRAVPQINVLITSLPVNILVGFLILIISLPMIIFQMHGLLDLTAERLFQTLKAF